MSHEARLQVRSMDLSAPEVGAGHVLIALNVTLVDASKADHRDLIEAKTYDSATGFLVQTRDVELRDKMPAHQPVLVSIDLPRSGSYWVDVQVFDDGQPSAGGRVDLRDLARLQPTLHDSGLRIDLDFQLLAANATRTDVLASAYLTNEARDSSRPLTLQVKARDARTGLVAAQRWTPVGAVGPDETRSANATLGLALGHDYDVEAILWDGNVVVERGFGRIALATLGSASAGGGAGGLGGSAGSTTAPAGDLVFGQPTIRGATGGSSGAKAPGLGLVAVVGVLCLIAVVARRRAP